MLSIFKELKLEPFARSLYKFYNECNHSHSKIDEVAKLGDAIVERACFKKMISASNKSKYEEAKRAFLGTSAYSGDTSNDSHFGKVFNENQTNNTGSPHSVRPPNNA